MINSVTSKILGFTMLLERLRNLLHCKLFWCMHASYRYCKFIILSSALELTAFHVELARMPGKCLVLLASLCFRSHSLDCFENAQVLCCSWNRSECILFGVFIWKISSLFWILRELLHGIVRWTFLASHALWVPLKSRVALDFPLVFVCIHVRIHKSLTFIVLVLVPALQNAIKNSLSRSWLEVLWIFWGCDCYQLWLTSTIKY